MTTDKLSTDPILAHFDHVRECITRRWFKVIHNGRGVWEEPGTDDSYCLVTPKSGGIWNDYNARVIMKKCANDKGFAMTSDFNNHSKTTKEDIFTFLDECKRIRVAELLEAVVT